MRVAIEPRKATDRGGYYCMPLKVNVPTGRKNWKLTKCPECGQAAIANLYRKCREIYPYCPWCGQKLQEVQDETEKENQQAK